MNLPDFLVDHPDCEIRLTGHRIGLADVVFYYNEGYSSEMLVGQFPTLPLALVHKVIAFDLENQAEVDAYVAQHEAECARLRASAPASPGLEQLRRARGWPGRRLRGAGGTRGVEAAPAVP